MKFIFVTLLLTVTSASFAKTYPVMRVIQKDFKENVYLFFPLCGLGSEVFSRDSWLSSSSASSVNVSLSPFAPTLTTFNMSQCKGPKYLVKNEKLLKFAKDNLILLASEISRGQGEALQTLAVMLQIPESDHEKFFKLCKENFFYLFPTQNINAGDFLDNIAWVTANKDVVMPMARNYDLEHALR